MPIHPRLLETLAESAAAEAAFATPTGEVSLHLSHPRHDPLGVTLAHRAGNFQTGRLLMIGGAIYLDRHQLGSLLGQWRRLTQQIGFASGWTITRTFVADEQPMFDGWD